MHLLFIKEIHVFRKWPLEAANAGTAPAVCRPFFPAGTFFLLLAMTVRIFPGELPSVPEVKAGPCETLETLYRPVIGQNSIRKEHVTFLCHLVGFL